MTQLPLPTASSSSSSVPAPAGPAVPFGRAMREAHFAFSPSYTPLNHGSYGTYPTCVGAAQAAARREAEAAPDPFIVLEWAARLRAPRALTAGLLGCATDDLVFVPNATTGIDTVLKNLRWRDGDVILAYETVYDSVRAGLDWVAEMAGGAVRVEVVPVPAPLSDDAFVDAVTAVADRINNGGGGAGERVRLAVVDTVVSMPGLRAPFERLVPALRARGALVLVDGAHGVGHVPVDLAALRPDFFVTNLHKWLFVPRGAAALYVAAHRQHLVRSTLPTSYRFRRNAGSGSTEPDAHSFVELFDFTATLDMTNFLTVEAALDFRTRICGGEEAIRRYCFAVAREGGEAAAQVLGTEVMDAPGSCMRECNFANVRLPIEIGEAGAEGQVAPAHAAKVCPWIKATGVAEAGCYFQVCVYRGAFWWRLSGMIYVDVDDFRRGAVALKGLCERVAKGEFLEA
ncbi:putative aminotransferase family protein [Rosellinia necatrix]|uniref:Putative aminotransferase family protein n=1 Tax=Rosellinia necatrix TaxID=77044 RepID=A0A1W2TAT6_ROSNE|nr:putative aminotransferase family protein [Rosellinia necatrix]